MTAKQRIDHITRWITEYATTHNISTLVVGISGGIDSSVVSALCATTGINTIVVQMPIRQNVTLDNRSLLQAIWLAERFDNVRHLNIDLNKIFNAFEADILPFCLATESNDDSLTLGFANSRARLRMMALYQIAQSYGGIVVGTGNKVEDFGVGFFTKYGDGGVDISPIGDCMKTDVWDMGGELGIPHEIIYAFPTDGLWDDGRTDESQLGMSYAELEVAMQHDTAEDSAADATPQEIRNLEKYRLIRNRNIHKMNPIPVCKMQ